MAWPEWRLPINEKQWFSEVLDHNGFLGRHRYDWNDLLNRD